MLGPTGVVFVGAAPAARALRPHALVMDTSLMRLALLLAPGQRQAAPLAAGPRDSRTDASGYHDPVRWLAKMHSAVCDATPAKTHDMRTTHRLNHVPS